MAGGHSLGIPPENQGVVLSERSESKGNGGGPPGLDRGTAPSQFILSLPRNSAQSKQYEGERFPNASRPNLCWPAGLRCLVGARAQIVCVPSVSLS